MNKLIKSKKSWIPLACILLVAAAAIWTSCRDDLKNQTFVTSDDLTIDDYITKNDPSMSMFLDIAEKAKFRGTLHAYGKYTCFIPTNDGIMRYLQNIGKSSIDALTPEECFDICKYHVISMPSGVDSLTSASFVDGRLPIPNMRAKYLTIRTVQFEGRAALEVNRQAIVLEADIRAVNGYIQKINNVLIPSDKTVGEQIEALPENFSLFKNIMRQTKFDQSKTWMEKLSEKTADTVWYTVFVQSNESFENSGVTESNLLEKLREFRVDIQESVPYFTTRDDSLLWNFASYYVVDGLNYVADLTRTSSLLTFATNQAITFTMRRDSLIVNQFLHPATGAVEERGALVDRLSEFTDLSCDNGVMIEMKTEPNTPFVGTKLREARAVYWDICSQPEWRTHPNYTKADIPQIDTREMSEIWCYDADGNEVNAPNLMYKFNPNQTDAKWQVVNHDYLQYQVRNFAYIDFKIPLLLPGTYNLWTCVRRDGNPVQVRVRFLFIEEGEEPQRLDARDLYFQYNDIVKNEADMINYGAKRYAAKSKANETFALLCGTFVVTTTGRHKVRMEVVNLGTRNGSENSFLDMFQFIPIDDDQYWPRFDRAGNPVFPDTPCQLIFPYETTGCNMGTT